MSYGFYNGFGEWTEVIGAGIQALPGILNVFNPHPPPMPPPPDHSGMYIGAGLGALMIVGGIAYMVMRK